jgi:hypothetical protein
LKPEALKNYNAMMQKNLSAAGRREEREEELPKNLEASTKKSNNEGKKWMKRHIILIILTRLKAGKKVHSGIFPSLVGLDLCYIF